MTAPPRSTGERSALTPSASASDAMDSEIPTPCKRGAASPEFSVWSQREWEPGLAALGRHGACGGGGARAPVPALPSRCCGPGQVSSPQSPAVLFSRPPQGLHLTPCAHETVSKPASVPVLPLSVLLCFLARHTGPLALLDRPRGLPPQGLSLPSVWKDLPQRSAWPTPPVTQALRPAAGQPLVLPLPHWAHHRPASQTKTRLAVEQARHRGGIPGDSTRTRNLEQLVHRGRKLGGAGLGGRQNGRLLFN